MNWATSKRVIVAAAFASTLLVGSVAAQTTDQATGPAQVVAPAPVPQIVAPPAAPVQQNTIRTTAPVSSETTISVGTLAGQLLNWVVLGFSGPIGGLAVWIMVRALSYLGVKLTDAGRARLDEMVVNGLNIAAPLIEQRLAGEGKVAIKNAVVASAVAYVQDHGADTIKKLGLDPQSGAAVEAIKARIETAIADPTVPTPAVLDPPTPSAPPTPPLKAA
jgi:hypothetical protein